MGAGQPAEDGITALGLDYRLLTAFTSFVAVDSQVVNAGGQGQERAPAAADARGRVEPRGRRESGGGAVTATGSMGARCGRCGAMGTALGIGVGGGGLAKAAAPPAPAARPRGAEPSLAAATSARAARRRARPPGPGRGRRPAKDEKASDNEEGAPSTRQRRLRGTVTAARRRRRRRRRRWSRRSARRSRRAAAACLRRVGRRQSIRLRLTVDAGDGSCASSWSRATAGRGCLRTALAGLSSATVARGGGPTGTVEITLGARGKRPPPSLTARPPGRIVLRGVSWP